MHLAVIVAPDDAPGEAEEWVPLRSVLPSLAEGSPQTRRSSCTPSAWPSGTTPTRFCPRCGGTLEPRRRPRAAVHAVRPRAQFPRTDPAVIMADHARRAGTTRRSCSVATGLAGRSLVHARRFCEPGETLEDAVRREVDEEVGVRSAR